NPRALMPGRIIEREDDGFPERSRIGPGEVTQVSSKSGLQPGRLGRPGAPRGLGGTLQQACGELAGHHGHAGKTIDELLVVPGPDYGAMALDPQGGSQRGHERKARFILAY